MTSLIYPETMECVSEEKDDKTKYSISLFGLIGLGLLVLGLCVAMAVIFFYVGKQASSYEMNKELSENEQDKNISSSTVEASSEPTPEELRIPRSTKPINYKLRIKIFLPFEDEDYGAKNFTFSGELSIQIVCLQKTSKITLNLNGLRIDHTSIRVLESIEPGEINFDKIVYQQRLQMVEIHLKQDLKVGEKYTLSLSYTGPITDTLAGFYRSTYVQNGKIKYIATTQFQPVDARRALPCYDEPDLKATFTLSIIHPVGTVALANGAVLSEGHKDGWIDTKFERTPNMSTYLLAFVIGDLKMNEGKTKSGVTFRIWSRPEMVSRTKYAVKVGPEVLDLFEDYFQIKYPMKKQDMVALPDFSFGAMENWGIILYKENYLLYDPKLYDLRSKQLVAQIIAHELAHQWFGNLVTMKWWDDIWLNEGFASYMEYIGTETESAGNFDMKDQFFNMDMDRAMGKDQTANSHPLSTLILKANDVDEIFDVISYKKGALIIRMLNKEIGDKAFKAGITKYLNEFSYSNTHYTDLWNILSQSVPEDKLDWNGKRLNVTEWMGPWTRQMGFPQINVQINAENNLVISQKRFKMNPQAMELPIYQKSPFNYQWYIPVTYKVISSDQAPGSQVNHTAWLKPNQQKTLQRNVGAADVFSLNSGVFGYYRVNYDLECWKRIINQLETNHKVFDVLVRSSMVSDAFTFAEAGTLNYHVPLTLINYLNKDQDFSPWQSAFSGLSKLNGYFKGSHKFYLFKAYMQKLLAGAYKEYPLTGNTAGAAEGVMTEQLRKTIASESCYYDVLDCQENMVEQFQVLIGKCGGDEQLSACHEMLNRTIHGNEIRDQNVKLFLNGISENIIGQYLMWDFLQENINGFVKKFESSPSTIASLIKCATVNLSTRQGQKMWINFIKDHPETSKKYGVFRQIQERISSDIKWKDTNFDYLINWFEKN